VKHIAVVPVFDSDSQVALNYARRLAPVVIAVGFDGQQESFGVPLVTLADLDRSWNQRVEHVIAVLKRNERPDRITLVVPESVAELFAETGVDVAAV
jgi:hypothetical protein